MRNANIMIVEDSLIVSFHLKQILEQAGFNNIVVCDSGERALELAAIATPKLIFMDIMLNGDLDGIETAKNLKERHATDVIFISALTDPATLTRAGKLEPVGYLVKPFEEDKIMALVNSVLH